MAPSDGASFPLSIEADTARKKYKEAAETNGVAKVPVGVKAELQMAIGKIIEENCGFVRISPISD
jgi:hypothetical protein